MTGGVTTASRNGTEGRDPSPSPGVKPASSGSSDEGEPWDEPPKKRVQPQEEVKPEDVNPVGSIMTNAEILMREKMSCEFFMATDDDGLEDGDLPPLSLKKQQRVSGQLGEKTKRPLSPPSAKGLMVKDNDPPMRRSRAKQKTPPKGKRPPTPTTAKKIAAQRQFWSQLDPASPAETETSLSHDQREEEAIEVDIEEGPDDEMAARRVARARELDDVSRQEDEEVDGDEGYRIRGSRAVSTGGSYEEGDKTCMEVTLASIANICGTGEPHSPIKEQRPAAPPRSLGAAMPADDAEEHTAIEVEYVDPGPGITSKSTPKKKKEAPPPPPRDEGLPHASADDGLSVELNESEASTWSANRKNAVLAAMARKAKEDFEKHEQETSRQSPVKPESPRTVESSAASIPSQDTNDVYNSFSPSEKRKFVKLINLGVTPSESASRVVQERNTDKDSVKPSESTGKKRFSFWKKTSHRESARSPANANQSVITDTSTSAPAALDQETKERLVDLEEPTGEDTLSGKSSTYSPPASPVRDDEETQESPAAGRGLVDGGDLTVDEESVEEEVTESGTSPAPVAAESDEEEDAPYIAAGVVAAGVAAGAAAAAAVATQTRSSSYEGDDESTEDEDSGIRRQFPKSGVNYYDGVRRELPEEEDSEEEDDDTAAPPSSGKSGSKGSRLAALTLSPRSMGFNSLHDKEKDSAQLLDADSEVSRSLSPRGLHSKSDERRSGALSPDSSVNARRRYLGIPKLGGNSKLGGNRFAPLVEEDADGVTDRDVIPKDETTENWDGYVGDGAQRSAPVEVETQDAKKSSTEERLNTLSDRARSPVFATTGSKDEASHEVPDLVDSSTEEQPLLSMDDPFYGIEGEDDKQSTDQVTEMDTSLDSYLDSATLHTYSSAASHHDHHSVLSGRTAGTGMTGVSSVHTHSTRKRRPGAAKDRLAKAKEAEKAAAAKMGWHESIRAAALNNNRVWDPQKGWIDYKDPSEDAQQTPTGEERLRISLEGISLHSPRHVDTDSPRQNDDESEARSVPLPFPPGWEKDRSEMISPQNGKPVSQQARAIGTPPLTPRSQADSDKLRTPEQNFSQSIASEDSASKPRDSVDSTKTLEKSTIESSPRTPKQLSEKDEESVGKKSRGSTSPTSIYAALTQSPIEGSIKEVRDQVEAESRSTEGPEGPQNETKIGSWIEKSAEPVSSRSDQEQSTEDSDQAVVANVGAEKYVQLGDNGSVRSVRRRHTDRDEKIPLHPRKASATRAAKAAKRDDDRAPLLSGSMTNSTEERAPEVKVVKEKCDEDDITLFSSTRDDMSSASTRRGKGPVDVDEVDNLDTETDSDEGDDQEPAWAPDSFMQGRVSPGMFVKPKSERPTEASRSGASTPTKSPPKLQKSRRDTSPIRADAWKTANIRSPRDVASPEVPPQVSKPSPKPSSAREDVKDTIQMVRSGDEIQMVRSGDESSSVKMMAQQWETRAHRGTHIPNDLSDSFDYDEKHASGLGDFSPSGDDEVTWPDSDDSEAKQPLPAGTQEWKSFLGKKVQAESEAAVRRDGTKKPDGSYGAQKIPIPRGPGSKKTPRTEKGINSEQQNDTTLSLTDGPFEVNGSPALSASSAAARRRDRNAQFYQSSPGGFSDVSPIQPSEDFDADDSQMERVSDSGTAIEQGTFMKRLSACAAPLSRAFGKTENGSGGAVPSAHLDFLRTNTAVQCSGGKSSNFVPPGLCGRPDTISEVQVDDEEQSSKAERTSLPTQPTVVSPERSAEMTGMVSDMRASSSVASEDFGARTSYLEAIAMRTAVSKKSRRKKQDRKSSSSSSVQSSESKLSHAERWQAFLERKSSQTASPPESRTHSSTDVSRAAEKYAAGKVEEMMEAMSSRAKSTPRSWRSRDDTMDTSGDSSASPLSPYRMANADADRSSSSASASKKKSESAKAAEELAAARVEAMMAAMTSSTLDQGEI